MRKLAIFAFSFAAATAAYIWLLPTAAALSIAGVLIIAAIFLFAKKIDKAERIRIFAIGAAIGLLWSWGYEQLKITPLRSLCGFDRTITATVMQTPNATKYGCKTAAKIEGGKIMLYLDCAPDELAIGDSVEVCADIIDVSEGSGEEDNLYFQSVGISLLGFQRGELKITKAESLPISCIPAYSAQITRERIECIFPDDVSGFAKALLTGDRSGLSYSVRNELSVTGISHVVAVSGMHVSLIVGIIMFLCRRRRYLAGLLSIPVMIFFAAMLGFTASVSRAVVMNSVFLLAPILKRENDAPTSLGLALLLILAFNPWAIANLSLQLSFSAMVGIFWMAPKVYQWAVKKTEARCDRKKHPLLFRKMKTLLVIFATTISANVFTIPLVAKNFGLVSVISPLTNLLTMPLLEAIFTLCFIAVLLSVWLPLGTAAGWLLAWPIRLVLWLVHAISKIPYAAVYTCSSYIVAWLVVAYLMIALFCVIKRKRNTAVLVGGVFITLVFAIVFSAIPTGNTAATAFDVGQGQCVLLRSGTSTVMVDCGGDSGDENGENVARKLLMSGQNRVDALILTHYDTDHVCGAAQLMQRIEVGSLYLPEMPDDSGNRERLIQIAQEQGMIVVFVSEDMQLQFPDGTIDLFVPDNLNEENASISALMSAQEYDILITGDMDIDGERRLLAQHELPKLELLIAGHHGSKNATGEELLEKTCPDAVLICVGKNSYGHPAQETLNRIISSGAAVYRTDLNGDITILR